MRYALRFLPDEAVYIQLNYFAHFRRFANLKNPVTYNETPNWLKLHDRNPLYTTLVDKYEVKGYVEKLIGGYTVPTIGVRSSVDDIDFDSLPAQFVLKCTHDSEELVICKDKSKIDINAAKEKLTEALKMNNITKNIVLTPLNLLYRISPETDLKLLFRIKQGYRLNLKNPKTYNEKL